MDFHSLTRKELQTLCKKNKIPANLTNVAMADALASLHHVEGLEEILEESKFESQQLSEEAMAGTPNVPRTTCRTSARRKPIGKEPESSQILTRTRRTTRRGGVAEEADQESIEVVPKTPAAPSSRRRAPPVSARQKTETQKEESSVQRAYSTRRSVRLLEKTMEELSLVENRKIQPFKIDELSKEETAADSSLTMSGTNMQTTSEVRSEKTEDFEVSSALKSDGSTEIRPDMNNDVQEKREDHVTELEVSMLKPESTESVEKSYENVNVNVLVETFADKEIDSVDKETQNKQSEDSKAEQHLGTEASLAALISDNVSTAVIAQDVTDDVSTAVITPDVAQDVSDDLSTDVVAPDAARDASDDVSTDVIAQDVAQDVSDDVSTDVITQDFAPKSSFMLEENEVSTVNESIEQIPLNLSSSFVENFSSEATTVSEEENGDESSEEESADSTALDDNSSKLLEHISDDKIESEEKETPLADVNAVESEIVVEDSYQGKRDMESESVTEEEFGDDISEEESAESEASDDDSVESDASDEDFTDSESVDDDNTDSEEKETPLVDVNAVESEIVVVEDSYQGKRDLESESITEEDFGEDISEEESVESEASDDESLESDASDEDFTDSESVDDDNTELDETDLEASLVDVDVTEGEVSTKTPSQSIPCHVDDSSKQESGSYGALVDVCVVAAEEFTTVTSEHLPPKSPPSLKETSPAHHMVSGSNVTTKSPLPTFSADQLSGQFPRPTVPTPSKSSSKSHPVIQMIADALDEHEENHAVPEKYENPTDDKSSSMPKLYGDASLRQLQKMLREKLQIENEKKVGKTRIALQMLPENRMAADEPQKEN